MCTVMPCTGFGTYQHHLFWLCGSGWLADNMWIQVLAVCLPALQPEFSLSDSLAAGTLLSLTSAFSVATTTSMLGMLFGSIIWGLVSDKYGRRLPFLLTLLIAAIFGTSSAFAMSVPMFCLLLVGMGLGVGGSLPTDGSLFLEFVPMRQSMLVLMSLFWPAGQVLASLLGWMFITTESICTHDCVPSLDFNGWRGVMFSVGLITAFMAFLRLALFKLIESPKYLLKSGQRMSAFKALHTLAQYNDNQDTLAGLAIDDIPEIYDPGTLSGSEDTSSFWDRMAPLFAPELRVTTILVWMIWASCSMAYSMYYAFLPKFLISVPNYFSAQADYVIISFAGVPGSVAAMYAVDTRLGRKGTMVVSTAATLISLLAFVVVSSAAAPRSEDPKASSLSLFVPLLLLICNISASFFSNIMWGVLYSFTPEAFPTNVRATAYGIASGMSKMAGIFAPLVTGALIELGGGGFTLPMWCSVLLFMLEGVLMFMLPFDTSGASAL
ncbi:MAG: hypothetical protein SGCHY_005496 [Lobulomycetales sp.]